MVLNIPNRTQNRGVRCLFSPCSFEAMVRWWVEWSFTRERRSESMVGRMWQEDYTSDKENATMYMVKQ